jgi:hypothetical protein
MLHIPAQWPAILTYAFNGFPTPQANNRTEYKIRPQRYLFTSFPIHYSFLTVSKDGNQHELLHVLSNKTTTTTATTTTTTATATATATTTTTTAATATATATATTTTTTVIHSFHWSTGNELILVHNLGRIWPKFRGLAEDNFSSPIHSSLLCAILRSGLVNSNPCFALIMMKSYRFYGWGETVVTPFKELRNVNKVINPTKVRIFFTP